MVGYIEKTSKNGTRRDLSRGILMVVFLGFRNLFLEN